MTTGYTASIKDGITFQRFALSCARAFGALIMMRDDPMDAPIPDEFKPSDYNAKRLIEINAALDEIEALPEAECQARADKEYQDRLNDLRKSIDEAFDLKGKYETMLSQVKAWIPPSADHKGLKDFMIQQITDSISFDSHIDYYEKEISELRPISGKEWKHKSLAKLVHEKIYNEDEHQKEISRTAGRNTWVRQLRDSLK